MTKAARKSFVRTIRPHVELHRDPRTGIAWVENGEAGIGHSCHPNISATDNVAAMKVKYWGKGARTVRSHGFIYCVDLITTADELDEIARDECRCVGCSEA